MESPPPESSKSTIRPDLLIRVKSGSITESITDAFTSFPARFRRRQPSESPSSSSSAYHPSQALLQMVSKITLKDIQGAKYCGGGGFGTVRIFEHPTKGKVALKQLRVLGGQLSDDLRRRTMREGETWQDLKHPWVLLFLGILETPTDLYLVSPYVKNGALDDYLRQNPDVNRHKFLWKTAVAIAYLHEHGIIHGDIKAANILVSDDVEPLLCDFGLAKCDDGVTSVGLQGVGTVRFQSPEVLIEGGGKSFASDIWAFGMTIFEVLSGKLPLNQYTIPTAIISAIVLRDERPPTLPSHSPSGLSYDRIWSVAQECWQKIPALRGSMRDIHRRLRPNGVALRGHVDEIMFLAISPDSLSIVSGSGRSGSSPEVNSLRLWDVASGRQQGEPSGGLHGGITCVAISPDGLTIVSGHGAGDRDEGINGYHGIYGDYSLRLWEVGSGRLRGQPLRGHTGDITCLAISPDGLTIVSGSGSGYGRYGYGASSEDNSIRLWDVVSGKQRGQPLMGHAGEVTCLAISLDGLTIVSASRGDVNDRDRSKNTDFLLRLWDVASGTLRGQPLRGHTGIITCLAISRDGMTIVSGSKDRTLRLWDMASGKQRGEPLRGHTGAVTCLAISPDGLTIVSGSGSGYGLYGSEASSEDNSIRLWDMVSGSQRGRSLRGHTGKITCLAISPNGLTIVSGSGYPDYTLRLWNL